MVAIEELKRAWADSSAADLLPMRFKQALEEIQLLHSPSASETDTVLDRLAASVEADNLGQMEGLVASIPTVKIELRNFLAAARGRSEEMTPSAIEEILLDGGYHSPSDIAESIRVNRLSALLGETPGFEDSALALEEGFESGSFLGFQKESDRMTMDILEKVSGDLFSPGPLAAYVLRRELEASHLKLVAAGKAAGIDSRRLSARIPRG
jgi:vacuolar-type H+-ATPase subunit C/Vma6